MEKLTYYVHESETQHNKKVNSSHIDLQILHNSSKNLSETFVNIDKLILKYRGRQRNWNTKQL